MVPFLDLMLCLEVEREKRVVERRVEGNGYDLPYLDDFKISKEEGSN